MKTRSTVNGRDSFRICKTLERVLHEGKDGLWYYDRGYSDEAVAEELTKERPLEYPKEAAKAVEYTRRRVFGNIAHNPGKGNPGMGRRIEAIETFLDSQYPDWRGA